MSKHVAVVRGEDASPEAVDPSVDLMKRLDLPIDWSIAPVGEDVKKTHGSPFADEARALIDSSDTTLFGATSGPSAGALFYLRWGKQTFANVRPARWVPGMNSPLAAPADVDFVIVRENLEVCVRVGAKTQDRRSSRECQLRNQAQYASAIRWFVPKYR